jgi:hypothetical protein
MTSILQIETIALLRRWFWVQAPVDHKYRLRAEGAWFALGPRSTITWTVVLVVSVKKDGGVVIIDHASFAHGPVLMRFNATLAWTEERYAQE